MSEPEGQVERGGGWLWPTLGVLLAVVILVSGVVFALQQGSDDTVDAPIDWSTVDPGDVSSLPDQPGNLAQMVN
jgi:hypothetical protein